MDLSIIIKETESLSEEEISDEKVTEFLCFYYFYK